MEDDDDIFGFGALSDMFDSRARAAPSNGASNAAAPVASAPVEPKRLDVAAMSRYWWSERRLNEFRRGSGRHAKEYHHIAAKFDGIHVDGGLGSAFVVGRGRSESTGRMEDGGVLWVQAQASDSNAQAKRKKEFQDITNRLPLLDRRDALKTPSGSKKSTATVFLSMDDILDAKETSVQNTAHGITFTLRSGTRFELAFMPGPYFDSRNRDELLEAFNRQQVEDVFSIESPHQPVATLPPPAALPAAPRSRTSSRSSSPSSREQTPQNSPSVVLTATSSTATAAITGDPNSIQNARRELIRRYVQVENESAEAIAIAQQVHSSTDYHIGPLATRIPNFSTDSAYKTRLGGVLFQKMEKLRHDWALSEQQRQLHTRARCGQGRNDTIEYTDTITLKPIPSNSYRERYMEFVEAEQPEAHPVIHMFEPRRTSTINNRQNSPRDEAHSHPQELPSLSPSTVSSDEEWEMFGVNLRQSALVNASLMARWQAMPLPTNEDKLNWRDVVDSKVLADASTDLKIRTANFIERLSRPMTTSTSTSSSANFSNNRSHRRRSLALPSLEDVRAEFNDAAQLAVSDVRSPSNAKRRRSDGDVSPTSVRRRRRQSLVGTFDASLLGEVKAEDGGLSSSNMEVDAIDAVCRICYDADPVVVLKPCGHSVCRGCWGRLKRVCHSSVHEGSDARECPWDLRDVVAGQSLQVQSPSGAVQLESEAQVRSRMFAKPRTSKLSGCQNSKAVDADESSNAHGRRRDSRLHGDDRRTVTLQQFATTSQRLLQWKEQAQSKRSKQSAVLQERKRQEDAFFVAIRSKVMSQKSVADAAERNYEVAQEAHWRRLELKTQLEQAFSSQEAQECTFQPELYAPPSKLAKVKAKYADAKTNKTAEIPLQKKSHCRSSAEVFDRLYLATTTSHRDADGDHDGDDEWNGQPPRVANIVEFLQRQEQFQRIREEKLQRLTQETQCSFSPELSERSRELGHARRERPINELLQQERERRERKLNKCLGRRSSQSARPRTPKDQTKGSGARPSSIFSAPTAFTDLLLELQDQEERMKALERRRTSTE